MSIPIPGSRAEEPDEARVVTLRRQLLAARRAGTHHSGSYAFARKTTSRPTPTLIIDRRNPGVTITIAPIES